MGEALKSEAPSFHAPKQLPHVPWMYRGDSFWHKDDARLCAHYSHPELRGNPQLRNTCSPVFHPYLPSHTAFTAPEASSGNDSASAKPCGNRVASSLYASINVRP